jgi:DNA-binding IclR family transcriptional regulator
MAVAVHAHGRAVAALNITWPSRRIATEEVVARHLGTLQATAALIGAELTGNG